MAAKNRRTSALFSSKPNDISHSPVQSMFDHSLPSSQLNEVLGRNAAAELLRTAALGDPPQLDGGESNALDEVDDPEPRRSVVARHQQTATPPTHSPPPPAHPPPHPLPPLHTTPPPP